MESNIYRDRSENETKTDILELLFVFRKKAWVIILAASVGCFESGIYSRMVLESVYTFTSTVHILSGETTLTSLVDLRIGSQLTKDYSAMVTSRPVLEQVIENRGLNLSYTQLKNMIRTSNSAGTGILNMSVSDTDPVKARATVNAVAKAFSDYIGDIMEVIPPKIIENGVVPSALTSPNMERDTALGGLAMTTTTCGIMSLRAIMSDTIHPGEDVSRHLGISILAAIPEDGEAENNPLVQKSKRKENRKKRKPISEKSREERDKV